MQKFGWKEIIPKLEARIRLSSAKLALAFDGTDEIGKTARAESG
ncbi:hypothetical protein [Algoriphagus sp.]